MYLLLWLAADKVVVLTTSRIVKWIVSIYNVSDHFNEAYRDSLL